MKVAIVTCAAYPDLSASDALYRNALTRRGVHVEALPWNTAKGRDFASLGGFDAVVLRSPWDYPHHIADFRSWLNALEERNVPLFNPPDMVGWSVDKRYVFDLEKNGIKVPRTFLIETKDGEDALLAAISALGAESGGRAVMKPAWGGSGFGVTMVSAASAKDDLRRAREEAPGRPLIVQAYLPEIATTGEISFVFVGGRFAHAVRIRPAQGEFRVNSRYRPRPPERVGPKESLLEAAAKVLAAIPSETIPLYARIDGVEDGQGDFICLEAEVVDPTLFLNLAPETADLLADATREYAAGSAKTACG